MYFASRPFLCLATPQIKSPTQKNSNELSFDQIHSVETEVWQFEDDRLEIAQRAFKKITYIFTYN